MEIQKRNLNDKILKLFIFYALLLKNIKNLIF